MFASRLKSSLELFRNRDFRLLWSARTVSYLGDTLANVALIVYASRGETGATGVGLLLLAQTVPRLLGPLAGTLADRFSRKRLIILSDLAQASVFFAVSFLPPLPVLLTLVAVGSLFATLFTPASRSLLPSLVSSEELGRANAQLGVSLNLGLALGPALASLLVASLGLRGTFALNTLTFLLSALLVARIGFREHRVVAQETVTDATLEGLRYISADPALRALAVGFVLSVMFIGLDNVALIFLARDTLGSEASYGLLLSANGLGMVLGPLLFIALTGRVGFMAALLLGFALEGTSTLLTGLAPTVAFAALYQGVMGLGNAVENVAFETLVQRWATPKLIGRVFGVMYTLPYLALLITYSVGGPLLEATSPRAVFVIAGAGTLFALALMGLLLKAARKL